MKKIILISGLMIALLLSISGCSTVSAKYYGMKYCSAEPNPNTWIGEVVEKPISIYWEDELYNGFTDEDAKLMVKNYLDGVHLQTMALNTPDGNVKIYSYKNPPQSYLDLVKEGFVVAKEWKIRKKASSKAFNEAYDRGSSKYRDGYSRNSSPLKELSAAFREVDNKRLPLQDQIEKIKQTLTLVITQTTKENMPKTNYTVTTKKLPLPDSAKEYIYMDEVKIIDNIKNKVIAYNTRVMQRYSSSLVPDFVGGRGLMSEPICGGKMPKKFDHGVFIYIGRSSKLAQAKHINTFR